MKLNKNEEVGKEMGEVALIWGPNERKNDLRNNIIGNHRRNLIFGRGSKETYGVSVTVS